MYMGCCRTKETSASGSPATEGPVKSDSSRNLHRDLQVADCLTESRPRQRAKSNRFGVIGRWQKVWSVSLSAHLCHDSALNVQTLTEAGGKVGWGVYGSTWAYREEVGGERGGGGLGKFTIAGRVVDTNGNGVADLELQVGKQTVYTGASGGLR